MTDPSSIRRATYDGLVEGLSSRAELAQLLGVSERTIDNQVRRGMPSIMVGSRRLFRYGHVLRWLSENSDEL